MNHYINAKRKTRFLSWLTLYLFKLHTKKIQRDNNPEISYTSKIMESDVTTLPAVIYKLRYISSLYKANFKIYKIQFKIELEDYATSSLL